MPLADYHLPSATCHAQCAVCQLACQGSFTTPIKNRPCHFYIAALLQLWPWPPTAGAGGITLRPTWQGPSLPRNKPRISPNMPLRYTRKGIVWWYFCWQQDREPMPRGFVAERIRAPGGEILGGPRSTMQQATINHATSHGSALSRPFYKAKKAYSSGIFAENRPKKTCRGTP